MEEVAADQTLTQVGNPENKRPECKKPQIISRDFRKYIENPNEKIESFEESLRDLSNFQLICRKTQPTYLVEISLLVRQLFPNSISIVYRPWPGYSQPKVRRSIYRLMGKIPPILGISHKNPDDLFEEILNIYSDTLKKGRDIPGIDIINLDDLKVVIRLRWVEFRQIQIAVKVSYRNYLRTISID